MTVTRCFFEDFGCDSDGAVLRADVLLDDETSQEEHRIEAFEQGYRAGWDDAVKSMDDDQIRVKSDLEKNLRDLSFTYAEVQVKMTRSVEGLLKELVNALFPKLLRDTLKAHVLEELYAATRARLDVPVEITVAPANLKAIEAIMPEHLPFSVNVIEEPTLGEGQAHLRVGTSERVIDLDAILTSASNVIDGYFELQEGQEAYG